jgi:hypothetical protein
MLAKRQAVRDDPEVQRALDDWWTTTDADGNGTLDHDEYIELGKALYRVMLTNEPRTNFNPPPSYTNR